MLTAKYTKRLASVIKWMIPLIMAIALLFGTSGCGKSAAQPEATTAAFELVETTAALQSSAAQQPGAPVMTSPSQEDKTISQSETAEETTEAFTEESKEALKAFTLFSKSREDFLEVIRFLCFSPVGVNVPSYTRVDHSLRFSLYLYLVATLYTPSYYRPVVRLGYLFYCIVGKLESGHKSLNLLFIFFA